MLSFTAQHGSECQRWLGDQLYADLAGCPLELVEGGASKRDRDPDRRRRVICAGWRWKRPCLQLEVSAGFLDGGVNQGLRIAVLMEFPAYKVELLLAILSGQYRIARMQSDLMADFR